MKRIFIFLVLLFIMLIPAGCIGGTTPLVKTVDWANELVFIEYWGSLSSEVLSGEGAPPLMIDFPTYHYEEETSTLTSHLGAFGTEPEKINPVTVRIVLGNGLSLSGDVGGGASSGLDGINDLPYHPNFSAAYVLSEIDERGLVLIRPQGNTSLMEASLTNPLPTKGAWITPGQTLRYQTVEEKQDQQSIIRFTYTVTLKNRIVRRDHCLNSHW